MQRSDPSDVVRTPSEYENRYQKDLSVGTLASEKNIGRLRSFLRFEGKKSIVEAIMMSRI